jgi:hypothetical protein
LHSWRLVPGGIIRGRVFRAQGLSAINC